MNHTARTLLELLILIEGPQLQKELPKKLHVKRPTVKYHVDRLEQEGLIKKELIAEAGTIKIIQLKINNLALPVIRKKLNLSVNKITLISGFTFDPKVQDYETLKLPDITRQLLKAHGSEIDKLVCFTTQRAMEERERVKLPQIDRYIPYPFNVYQNPLFSQIAEKELANEILYADVIIDVTPLTKIFTITMLKLAHRYQLPVVYIARHQSSSHLIQI